MGTLDSLLLEGLYRIRLASVHQLGVLLPGYTSRALRKARERLARRGLIDHRRLNSGHTVWALTRKAHRYLAATVDLPARRFVDVDGLNTPHTRGTTEVITTFARLADATPGLECGWEVEVTHPYGGRRYVRPDAVIACSWATATGGHTLRHMFIEYDRGTADGARRLKKILSYNQARSYKTGRRANPGRSLYSWQDRYLQWPDVLFVFDNMTKHGAQARINRLAYLLRATTSYELEQAIGSYTKVAATTLSQLQTHNPFRQPIFTALPYPQTRTLTDPWTSRKWQD